MYLVGITAAVEGVRMGIWNRTGTMRMTMVKEELIWCSVTDPGGRSAMF